MNQLFTIGHSNQSQEEFFAMLSRHSVDCVVDVRSVPASKYSPQFNMEVLREVRIISVVPLTSTERRTIRKAFVVPSQSGNAVCFRRRNGSEDFLPIDNAEDVEVWQKISPGKIDIVTYNDGKRAVRVRNSGGAFWRWIQKLARFPKCS